ncbi:MAG TPA: Sir2 family NAD-dependent protein deacetylase [Chthoniobacteraceae bacterium]|nr:Sir2 family NAD-dependent protein deacetylase [Chthoniobacteraceae bacterium]
MGRLIILTGAGLSAESGLRTFRDSNGLWENHSIDEVCNGATWRKNHELVQKFYNDRRTQLGTAEPNAAHRMIAEWQRRYDTVILTQNVDDLLERAGCGEVVHLHGFLPEMQCVDCGHIWSIGYEAWKTGASCANCPSIKGVRPNIVFFGEMAPMYEIMWGELSAMTARDVFLVIGTSGVVLPVAQMAAQLGGCKILNNLAPESAIDDRAFTHAIYKPATQAVGSIDRILQEHLPGS